MEYEIKVIVPNAEAQMAFCNKLAMYRFHWMSEQKADEIPALLRLTGELGQILVLDLLERKIGIYPTEVYADRKKAIFLSSKLRIKICPNSPVKRNKAGISSAFCPDSQ